VADPSPKVRTIDAIAIPEQIPWRFVPREGLDHLLRCPRGTGMLGDVEMDDAAPFMDEDHQVGDGGFRGRTRYGSTVDCATSMPSFRSSPTIRGEPQVELACHICWMRSRTA
jgi:hypothetical protein